MYLFINSFSIHAFTIFIIYIYIYISLECQVVGVLPKRMSKSQGTEQSSNIIQRGTLKQDLLKHELCVQ